MTYVNFSNETYTLYTKNGCYLFSLDNNHTDLLDYINADLSSLPDLLEQYIYEIICLETLELKPNNAADEFLRLIISQLKKLHKYYEYENEYKKILVKEISNYFNDLLLYLIFEQKKLPLSDAINEKWYLKIITALIPISLLPDEIFPITLFDEFINHLSFYNEFIAKTDPYRDSEYELFVHDIHKPAGFIDEIRFQKELSNMLYFVLDISAKGLETLSINQRLYLHDKIFRSKFIGSNFSIRKRFPSFSHTNSTDGNTPMSNLDMDEIFSNLYKLRSLNIVNTGIPIELKDTFSTAVDYVQNVTPQNIFEEYEINSLQELLFLETMNMIYSNIIIRKCKNCGKYFVVTDRKIKYCNRIIENGKTCRDVGTSNTFNKRLENDELLKLYRRAYKTHNARLAQKRMTPTEFDNWKEEAKLKLELTRNGALNITDFEKWLRQ